MTENEALRLLNHLIDELYSAGVDVSYFPDKADKVLRKYAKKIADNS